MPIYEYKCSCGKELEFYRSMGNRHDVLCPECGAVPSLKISVPSKHVMCMTFTVVNGDGTVIGQRNDMQRTPMFDEFYGANGEVMQRLHYGQEMAAKEMQEELKETGTLVNP